jgi:hypothetical protein
MKLKGMCCGEVVTQELVILYEFAVCVCVCVFVFYIYFYILVDSF